MNPGQYETETKVLEDQAEVYARELHALYQAEKQHRQELAEDKLVLEYKLRELTALNTLFQRHLEYRREMETAYRELLGQLRQAAQAGDRELRSQLQRLVAEAEARLAAWEKGEQAMASEAHRRRAMFG